MAEHERLAQGKIEELQRAAIAATKAAYSPYSTVRVGAALLAADGRVFTGCNVENASYGLTICAERVAATAAVAAGSRRWRAIVIPATATRLPCRCSWSSALESVPAGRCGRRSASGCVPTDIPVCL